MTFQAKFNYQPSKRTTTTKTYEDGTPLYSEKRTAGTAKAEELLKTLVKPMPTPPKRFNGALR